MNSKSKKLLATSCVALLSLPALAASPYISKVYEYCPAPGQFVNILPELPEDATMEQALLACEEQICADKTPGLISLGAFGGYVTFGFDHPVVNLPGEYDFKVYGNAFGSAISTLGGSAEPGIVSVSVDVNGNGLPDDPWYELKGSEYGRQTRNVTITYLRPDPAAIPDPDPDSSVILDRKYIRWTTDDPELPEGYLQRLSSHMQSYWPAWIEDQTLQFTASRLPSNIRNTGTEEEPYYVLCYMDWGYVDNYPNYDERNVGFDIGNAVDAEGNSVQLGSIDFVRVHSAMCQSCGVMGETSTEVAGAEDLHPNAVGVEQVASGPAQITDIYTLQGERINPKALGNTHGPGTIYLIRYTDGTVRKTFQH